MEELTHIPLNKHLYKANFCFLQITVKSQMTWKLGTISMFWKIVLSFLCFMLEGIICINNNKKKTKLFILIITTMLLEAVGCPYHKMTEEITKSGIKDWKKNMQIIVENVECAHMKKPRGQEKGFTPVQKNKRLGSLSMKVMPDRPDSEN